MQYEVNLAAAHWRMEKLNEILPALQDKFEASLNRGVLLELENDPQGLVEQLVEAALAEAR